MKGKIRSIYTICITIVCVILIILLVRQYTKPDLYLDSSEVTEIIMIQEWDNGAKQITDEKDIKKICDAFNHVNMNKVSDYDTFLEQAPCGSEVYIFQFEFKNLQKIVVTYTVGQRICYNGNLYQTTNTAIKDFWNLDYRIYEWNPERLDLHSLF